jgi:transposase
VKTRALRGCKRRAKTDREHARWLRELLAGGGLPGAWIPSEHVRQWRSRARLRHALIGERTRWMQRIQATLCYGGIAGVPGKLRTHAGRVFLDELEVPADARERIEVLAMVDAIDAQIAPLERELRQLARRQRGCRALIGLYGVGELTSSVTLCELGDVGRLSASRKAVRIAGIDIGVHRSDRRARAGELTRQGSPQLRWALYEAAPAACRPSSPTTPTPSRSSRRRAAGRHGPRPPHGDSLARPSSKDVQALTRSSPLLVRARSELCAREGCCFA